jgi:hypothetical protein
MSSEEAAERDTSQVARFFVDLMATLTADDVGEEEAIALLRPIWSQGQRHGLIPTGGRELDEELLIAGFARIAVSMAHMMVRDRRAAGDTAASARDVWCELREFMAAIEDR